jgi:integrase
MSPSIQIELHTAGVTTFYEEGVYHFRISDSVPDRAECFLAQQQFAASTVAPKLAYLVLFDLVDPTVLKSLIGKTLVVHRVNTFTYLELRDGNDKVWRVALSDVSAALMPLEITIERKEIEELDAWFAKQLNSALSPKSNTFVEVRRDQICWAYLNLPSAVFTLWCGLIQTARLSTPLHLLSATQQVPTNIDATDTGDISLVPEVLDLLEQNRRVHELHDDRLVLQAMDCLTTHAQWTQRQHIAEWRQLLRGLLPRLQSATSLTVIVFGWICDLVSNGTVQKRDKSRYLTRRKYIQAAAPLLMSTLAKMPEHPSNWSDSSRRVAFQEALSSAKSSEHQVVSAALASFQQHLEDWHSLEPVFFMQDEVQPASVRAQFVPQHCIARALRWIDEAQMDDSLLKLHLGAALSLGASTPLRLEELLYLRFCNVHKLNDGAYEIEVTSRPGWRDVKTDNSKRRVRVHDEVAVRRLEQLLHFRQSQACALGDLLFSHTSQPDAVYRRYLLHGHLLRILKATTGDESMSFHGLRHTWASQQILGVFQQEPPSHHNPLVQKMIDIGHSSLSTTLFWYFHFQDEVVRTCVDTALAAQIEYSAELTATITGKNDSALRKRSTRIGLALNEVRRIAIKNAATTRQCIDLARRLSFVDPIAPTINAKALDRYSARVVFNVLVAWEEGLDDALIAARFGIDLTCLNEIKINRDQLLRDMASPRRQSAESVDSCPIADIKFSSGLQQRYATLMPAMDITEHSIPVIEGLRAWRACRTRYGQISLADIRHASKFLTLLAELGVKPESLRLHRPSAMNGAKQLLVAKLTECFRSIFAESPLHYAIASESPRFPRLYLTWADSSRKEGTPEASASVRGLDALLFALYIFWFGELSYEH